MDNNWKNYTETDGFKTETAELANDELHESVLETVRHILNEAETNIILELERKHSDALGEVYDYDDDGSTAEVVREGVRSVLAEELCKWLKQNRC